MAAQDVPEITVVGAGAVDFDEILLPLVEIPVVRRVMPPFRAQGMWKQSFYSLHLFPTSSYIFLLL